MSKEEKSLLDELWDAAGLSLENEKTEKKEDIPAKTKDSEQSEEIKQEIPEVLEENSNISKNTEEISTAPQPVAPIKEETAVKKKDIKFLVIYTIVFVIVISGLIGGSYVITSRIHQQMAEHNQNLNTSQSSLKNIQDENLALKEENAALKAENEQFSALAEDAHALLEGIGDMVEQDSYLSAAQNAYIDGDRTEAKQIMRGIDREKLSQPAKEHYDLLKGKLGL